MLILKNISKTYNLNKNTTIKALDRININFEYEKFYGIIGHSGSGKSTLINILGLLDNYDDGEYLIDNKNVSNIKEDEKAELRMKKFGFVFQEFYLNNNLTATENVIIPMILNKSIKSQERNKLAIELLNKFGLNERINHKPSQLSGGEKQRVAIARALANNPDVLIADEPTGNLDKENETMIFEYLKKLVKEEKKTVIIVTHNNIIKDYADIIYEIDKGKLQRGKI